MTLKTEQHPYGWESFVLPKEAFDKLIKAARKSSPDDGSRMTLRVAIFDYEHGISIENVLFTWDHQPPSRS